MLSDSRIPAEPYQNQFGFPIEISSMQTALNFNAASSAEGYFVKNADETRNKFYTHHFEYGGTGTLTFDAVSNPRFSVERAEVRIDPNNFRCNFRGHLAYDASLPGTPTVDLYWYNDDPIGPADVDVRELAGGVGYLRWRFSEKVVRRPSLPVTFKIVARANGSVLAEAVEIVDIPRIDFAD